jgi:hypothetical protein
LKTLKIDAEKVKAYDINLQEHIDNIIKGFLKSNVKVSNEEKLNDFIHDKDDVGIREYIPSGEG